MIARIYSQFCLTECRDLLTKNLLTPMVKNLFEGQSYHVGHVIVYLTAQWPSLIFLNSPF